MAKSFSEIRSILNDVEGKTYSGLVIDDEPRPAVYAFADDYPLRSALLELSRSIWTGLLEDDRSVQAVLRAVSVVATAVEKLRTEYEEISLPDADCPKNGRFKDAGIPPLWAWYVDMDPRFYLDFGIDEWLQELNEEIVGEPWVWADLCQFTALLCIDRSGRSS